MDYMIKARTYVEVDGKMIYGDWTEEIPVHTKEFLQYVKGIEPTCQTEGSIPYWIGKSTGILYADESQETILAPEEIILPKLEHIYEDQTDADGNVIRVCINCGEIEGE